MTPIYITGTTPDGTVLVGGVWALWQQEGFPLEMSHVAAITNGHAVDWLEAMADAGITNNTPAIVKQMETFLPADTMLELKLRFMALFRDNEDYAGFVAKKRGST